MPCVQQIKHCMHEVGGALVRMGESLGCLPWERSVMHGWRKYVCCTAFVSSIQNILQLLKGHCFIHWNKRLSAANQQALFKHTTVRNKGPYLSNYLPQNLWTILSKNVGYWACWMVQKMKTYWFLQNTFPARLSWKTLHPTKTITKSATSKTLPRYTHRMPVHIYACQMHQCRRVVPRYVPAPTQCFLCLGKAAGYQC